MKSATQAENPTASDPDTSRAQAASSRPDPQQDLPGYCRHLGSRAREAALQLARTPGRERHTALLAIADAVEADRASLQNLNARDLEAGREAGLSEALLDRLELTDARVDAIARSIREIADQPDPVGQIIEGRVLPNGIRLEKRRVPIGVFLMIYESRPNVTTDAAALALKSGNAVILRGGKEAGHTNTALADCIRRGLEAADLPQAAVQIVATTDRAAVGELLRLTDLIDLAIPRGGESLIRAVVEQAHIPVIKHYTGNCHTYIHRDAPEARAIAIAVNAKMQRTGVCNATETFIVHREWGRAIPSPAELEPDNDPGRARDSPLPLGQAADAINESTTLTSALCRALIDAGCEVRVDAGIRAACPDLDHELKDASEEDWATEFLGPVVAMKSVGSLQEAVDHINRYGSRHTDAIVTESLDTAEAFIAGVDTANCFVNCSTRFSDGGQYGLGAEIGISTDKLHARGPMGAADLTTYKWVAVGSGQLRE